MTERAQEPGTGESSGTNTDGVYPARAEPRADLGAPTDYVVSGDSTALAGFGGGAVDAAFVSRGTGL